MYNIRLTEFEDYKRTQALPLTMTETTEAVTIPSNTYAWSSAYKALHMNDASAGVKGSIGFYLGNAVYGDVVEFSAEVMNMSGVKAKTYIDIVGGGVAIALQSVKSGEFETIGAKYIVNKDTGNMTTAFGVFTTDIGEYYIRNINVKVNKKDNLSATRPAIRQYTFALTGGALTLATGYGPYTCTTVLTSTIITVTHGIPFTNLLGMAGTSFGNFNRNANAYYVRTSTETLTGFIMQIFDRATGVVVDPTTLLNSNLYLAMIHHGYDAGYSSPY